MLSSTRLHQTLFFLFVRSAELLANLLLSAHVHHSDKPLIS